MITMINMNIIRFIITTIIIIIIIIVVVAVTYGRHPPIDASGLQGATHPETHPR